GRPTERAHGGNSRILEERKERALLAGANVYFIPMGLFIKAGASDFFWESIGKTATDVPALTWSNFLFANLFPVSIGNIIGGSIIVGVVYWFVYLRKSRMHRARDI